MAEKDVPLHIKDCEIHRIADRVEPNKLYEIAVEYLGLSRPEVLTHIKNAGKLQISDLDGHFKVRSYEDNLSVLALHILNALFLYFSLL